MTTEYTATVRVEDGSLTVVRPHPSVGPVDDLVDSLVYTVRDDSTIVGIELHIEVEDAPDTGEQPTSPPTSPQTGSGAPTFPPVPTTAPDPLSGASTGA